jgi:hypothetical protein
MQTRCMIKLKLNNFMVFEQGGHVSMGPPLGGILPPWSYFRNE